MAIFNSYFDITRGYMILSHVGESFYTQDVASRKNDVYPL